MKKLTLLLLLLFLLITVASCKPFEGLIRTQPKQLQLFEVHTGATGVEMAFVENAPPAEVYENNLLELAVEVENTGGTDAEGVTVFGIPTDIMTIKRGTERNTFTLKGKTGTLPIGDRERFVILTQAKELLEERQTTTVTANTCYKYSTTAMSIVCIKPKTALQREVSEICTPQVKNFKEGQGGPVGVVKIEKPIVTPLNNGIKPTIILHIRNLGTGIVVAEPHYEEFCRSRTQLRQRDALVNIVTVNAKLSNQQLTCTPSQVLLEQNTEDTAVSCSIEQGFADEAGTYEALLEVKLTYGYVEQKTKNVVIKKIL
ncbi:MAG: hypothetical protein HY363_03235 [Candidatus Aenigmarchaeota archaeon]|nr:hypothetical protein [Candidatus Aenigmarchaeota archaeon]